MEYGIGLDTSLGITYDQDLEMSTYASKYGYTSIWTPEHRVYDSFVLCLERWNATREHTDAGLSTGIGVSPVNLRSPFALAMTASTISKRTNGKFILGIGSGGVYREATRNSLGLNKVSVLSLMTDYLSIIKPLVHNQTVNYTGDTVSLHNTNLGTENEYPTPIYLAALGPKMLGVGARLADGIALNWCSTEQIAWSREIIKTEAEQSGRNPDEIKVVQYIRMCIDNDVDLARKAFIQSMLGYALGSPNASPSEKRMGYRGHFERMGFSEELNKLDAMRSEGASQEKLIDSFPDELALKVGYFGKPEGAKSHFIKLSEGLDTAIVRVVAAKPEINSTKLVIDTCKP